MNFNGKQFGKMVEAAAKNALFDVSEGVLTDMVDEAPIKQGTLRRQHDIIKDRINSRVIFIANTPYATAVHDGSEPHIIKPDKAKALWWAGVKHPVGIVRHPGNKPNPWMKRVMDRDSDRIDEYILNRVDAAIERGFGNI